MNHLTEIKIVIKFVLRIGRLILTRKLKGVVERMYRIRMVRERRIFSEKNSLRNRMSQLKP